MMSERSLFTLYAELIARLRGERCESCDHPAQHVDPDGHLFCFDCATADPLDAPEGVIYYPGTDGER